MTTSPHSSEFSRSLHERVQERVHTAKLRFTQRRPKKERGAAPMQSPEDVVELRALRHVFHNMGRDQRVARHRTGQEPSVIVRQAALAFRDRPSFSALILVAASLDEVGLLGW